MFRFSLLGASMGVAVVLGVASHAADPPSAPAKEKIVLAAERHLGNADASIKAEVTINGSKLGVFEGDREVDISQYIKPGRNTIEIVNTPTAAVAATSSVSNPMHIKIGPVQTNERTKKRVMRPVLVTVRNDQDWSVGSEGEATHPFGPNPKTPDKKTVVNAFNFEYAGVGADLRSMKEGDYILKAESYLPMNPSVVATVSMNGKSLGSFHAGERALVVTDMLKAADNEIRVSTEAVPNQLSDIDIAFELIGPVAYDVAKKEFVGPKITSFKAMQGWKRNKTTHVLEVAGTPGAEKHERIVAVRMESAPK